MKKLLVILFIGISTIAFAGVEGDSTFTAKKSVGADKIFSANKPVMARENYNVDSTWKWGGIVGLNFSQVAIGDYWAPGGLSSLSLNGTVGLYANKRKGKFSWDSNLDAAYGMIKQGDRDQLSDQPWLKSDDKLEINTKIGHQIRDKKMSLTGLLNFKSQLSPGFSFPNDSILTSNFLAPGYLVFGAGLDIKPNKNFSAFIAPISTGKITFVNDQALADAGAFGVDKATFDGTGNLLSSGSRLRFEFGGFVKMMYKKDNLSENKESILNDISFRTNLDLFSNYLNNPQNIDVNWSILIGMKVNKYITASITMNIVYDHDIDFTINELDAGGNIIGTHKGPRTQFKEALGIGFSYKF
jgi:hypothetical protein